MSLRSRLLILTAFSVVALLIALLSAWRTAATSEAFARRQAELSVSGAAGELAREARDYPTGRSDPGGDDKNKRMPPHEREIFARFTDSFERSAAIALHRFGETAGGFCLSDGNVQALVSGDNFGFAPTVRELEAVVNVCRQTGAAGDFTTQQIVVDNRVLLVSAQPLRAQLDLSETRPDSMTGTVAFRRWQPSSVLNDSFSLLTQGFLLLSVVGLAAFSFLTWRDWQRGMKQIETGLEQLSGDLEARIVSPPVLELKRISQSINDLATNLKDNLIRQKELEQSIAKNEKLVALGRVVAGVAHEVRNPLASIKLKIQLAERHKFDGAKMEKTFLVLGEEIDRLDTLVKKLLDVSRPAKLNFSSFSLVELIVQRISLLVETAAGQNVTVELDRRDETTQVFADRERLAQVFDNLFRNSLEAMPEGGKLKIRIEKAVDSYLVYISDEGQGFSPTERERLFEPFFTTKETGTGLGLTISREIAKAHGGTIYLSERAESGATFIVELPSKL